jgi:hypothetical protein
MDWHDSKWPDLEKKPFAGFISRIIIKKGQNRKSPPEGEREEM